MKRSGFVRPKVERQPVPAYTLTARPNYARCEVALPVPKAQPVRSEAYRRLVAALPCANCGAVGRSQAAHPNTGKGMGMKADDRWCVPLCGPAPGDLGCHARFDQHALYAKADRRNLEVEWAAKTVQTIFRAGQWPPALDVPVELIPLETT